MFQFLKMLIEQENVKPMKDFWEENKQNIKSFNYDIVYLIKPSEKNHSLFDVYKETTNKNEFIGSIKKRELDDLFSIIDSNVGPDVEGFLAYKRNDDVEAFQYNGEDVKIQLTKDSVVTVQSKDYVVKTIKNHKTKYSVVDKDNFDSLMVST